MLLLLFWFTLILHFINDALPLLLSSVAALLLLEWNQYLLFTTAHGSAGREGVGKIRFEFSNWIYLSQSLFQPVKNFHNENEIEKGERRQRGMTNKQTKKKHLPSTNRTTTSAAATTIWSAGATHFCQTDDRRRLLMSPTTHTLTQYDCTPIHTHTQTHTFKHIYASMCVCVHESFGWSWRWHHETTSRWLRQRHWEALRILKKI